MGIVDESRRDGELVYSCDQSQTPVLTQPGPWGSAYDGFCAGMAIRWLKLQMQGQDYAFDPRTLKMSELPYHAVIRQNTVDSTWAKSEYEAAITEAGLRVAPNVEKWSGGMNVDRMGAIAAADGFYLLYLRGNGAHAVAAWSSGKGSNVHFFDANYGHFRISGGTEYFKKWFAWFFSASGYKAQFNAETKVYEILQATRARSNAVSLPPPGRPRSNAVSGRR